MKKPSDTSDGGFDLSDVFPTGSSNVLGGGAGSPGPTTPQLVEVSAEAQEAAAAAAASGPGGPGSVVAVTGSSGFTINLEFDAAAMAAPASFRAGIQQAAALLSAAITDPITVNISIDYSGTGGGAAAGPSNGIYVNYSTVRADLVNNASAGDTAFSSLPTGSTIAGQTSVAVWDAQEKLWGLISPTGSEVDGNATFATDISSNLLVGVALHELTHAMGRVPYAGTTGQTDIFDFFRFTSAGNILVSGSNTAPPAYFSLNGGTTKIADYGQTSDPSDFLNSGVQGSTDPFDEFYSNGTQQQLTAIDLQQLDALGFHLVQQTTTVIEAKGVTELVQVGSNYFLDPVAGGTGPELKYGGTAFTAGEWGSWAPIGAEAISGGYEVAFKIGADTYTVWDTDTNGNITTNALGTTSGSSPALESLETSFHQDLNGDGIIGIPPAPASTTIESFGSTALVQTGNNYFLNPVAGGAGPELKYGGVAFTASSTWGAWAPIGAEVISGGYEVAFKIGSNTFTVWDTDASGNITTNALGTTSGSSPALESLETSFHQDLNGDGIIGIPPAPASTTIESFGSTALVQTGNNYFLNPVAGGTGPELKYGGVAFTAGSTWGSWAPIGAEAISGGYEVAFKIGTDTYTVWDTDANGNITTNALATTSGSSTSLEALETSFQQDLNGDHIIGIPSPTSPAAQVASAAPTAPSLGGGGDGFAFRPDLGATASSSGAASTLFQQIEHAVASSLEHFSTELQHIIAAEVQDLTGAHDNAAHGPLFDALHGFLIH